MSELRVFEAPSDPTAATAAFAQITTSYDSANTTATRVFAVSPGVMTVLANFAGPTSIELEFSFATGGSPNSPPAATDTNWYGLVGMTGSSVPSVISVLPGRSIVDPSSRGLTADDTLEWGGRIPPYMSWMRVRVKKTGASAITSLRLSVFCQVPSYSQ